MKVLVFFGRLVSASMFLMMMAVPFALLVCTMVILAYAILKSRGAFGDRSVF